MGRKMAAVLCVALCTVWMTACDGLQAGGVHLKESRQNVSESSTNASALKEGSESDAVLGEVVLSEQEQEDLAVVKAIFDWLYPLDDALNEGIEWIALDTTELEISDVVKKQLFEYIGEQSGFSVRESTAQELKDEGLLGEQGIRTGILLTMSMQAEEVDTRRFSAEKYRSPLGAIGVNDGIVQRDGTVWKIDDKQIRVFIS